MRKGCFKVALLVSFCATLWLLLELVDSNAEVTNAAVDVVAD